jgi:hypothetical protein
VSASTTALHGWHFVLMAALNATPSVARLRESGHRLGSVLWSLHQSMPAWKFSFEVVDLSPELGFSAWHCVVYAESSVTNSSSKRSKSSHANIYNIAYCPTTAKKTKLLNTQLHKLLNTCTLHYIGCYCNNMRIKPYNTHAMTCVHVTDTIVSSPA